LQETVGLARRNRSDAMGKPVKHGGKWKIRWFEQGRRRAQVFELHEDAKRALRAKEQQRDDVRRGLRAEPARQSFGDLCDYWIEHRVPRKRSGKDDESIFRKHLRPAFGAMRLRDLTVAALDSFINAKRASATHTWRPTRSREIMDASTRSSRLSHRPSRRTRKRMMGSAYCGCRPACGCRPPARRVPPCCRRPAMRLAVSQ
jgi:hypothetical protein